jgi:hypothetical protein
MTARKCPERPKDSKEYCADKLALADLLRRDGRLSATARLVGAEIICRSWQQGGCTDAQGWFQTVLDISERAVKAAVAELQRFEYIRIEKHGRSNHYFLMLEKVQNLPQSKGEQPKTSAMSPGHGVTEAIGAKNDVDRGKKRPATGAKSDPLIPLVPISTNTLGDPDGEGLPPAENEIQIKAKTLAIQLAAIAGLEQKPWPLHWQNAPTVIARWWDQGWTHEEIVTGARLTMQNKEKTSLGPPASIEYFEPEIGRLVAKRKQTLSTRDLQTALRAIAQRIGWPVVTELSHERATELCERWSRNEVTDQELHALKTEIEQAIEAARPRAASA